MRNDSDVYVNRVRGAAAKLRSTVVDIGLHRDPNYMFHREIKNILVDARTKLSLNDGRRLLAYIDKVMARLSPKERVPTNFAAIGSPNAKLKVLPLDQETNWAACRIFQQAAELISHREFVSKIEYHLIREDFKSAIRVLIKHEIKLGQSIWGCST